jgi:gluconate kinase
MPPSLLESQLAILQPPTADEAHLVQDIEQTPAQIIAGFLAGLR